MTDRAAFLSRIRLQPLDCSLRLVFADWLDDHAESDLDRATAEFIRISCRVVQSRTARMPVAAYPWLKANWQRLVPSFWRATLEHGVGGSCSQCRGIARFEVKGHQPVWFHFKFRRGFLDTCTANAPPALTPLVHEYWQLVLLDQPLATPESLGSLFYSAIEDGVQVFRDVPAVHLPTPNSNPRTRR